MTITYCKKKSKKTTTRGLKRKLEKDLENKMRSCDEELEENITLNTEIENIQTELEKKYMT